MNMVAQQRQGWCWSDDWFQSRIYKFDVVSSSFAGPLRVSVSEGNSIIYISW